MDYRASPFVTVFSRENSIALFHHLDMKAVYLTLTEHHSLIQGNAKNKMIKSLFENEFIVPLDFDAVSYFQKFRKKLNFQEGIGVAYFLLTSKCNFRCKYCFIKTRMINDPKNVMSLDTAKKAVDLISRNTKNIRIIFYGGEPLLNKEVLKFVVEYSEKVFDKVSFLIVSNAALIDEEISLFLKEHKVNTGISLDGPAEINDIMRVNHQNKGTYNEIVNGIHWLQKKNVPFGLSITLGQHNMDKAGSIVSLVQDLNIRGVGLNLLNPNNGVDLEREKIIDTAINTERQLRKNGVLEDRLFNRKIKPFLLEQPFLKECAAYGNQLVITPDGLVGVCHGLWPDLENNPEARRYFPLTVDYQGKLTDHPLWKEWGARNPFNMPECFECCGIGFCGGGCAKNSVILEGNMWKTDKLGCEFTKKMVETMIWDYFDGKYDKLGQSVGDNLLKQRT